MEIASGLQIVEEEEQRVAWVLDLQGHPKDAALGKSLSFRFYQGGLFDRFDRLRTRRHRRISRKERLVWSRRREPGSMDGNGEA